VTSVDEGPDGVWEAPGGGVAPGDGPCRPLLPAASQDSGPPTAERGEVVDEGALEALSVPGAGPADPLDAEPSDAVAVDAEPLDAESVGAEPVVNEGVGEWAASPLSSVAARGVVVVDVAGPGERAGVEAFRRAARSANTLAAYRADWDRYTAWSARHGLQALPEGRGPSPPTCRGGQRPRGDRPVRPVGLQPGHARPLAGHDQQGA